MQLVHVRLRASEVLERGVRSAANGSSDRGLAPAERRSVVFSGEHVTVDVHERASLPEGARVAGPAIIEEYSGTTVLPPGSEAHVVGGLGLLIQETTR